MQVAGRLSSFLRPALRHRRWLALAMLCSLAVGVLWSANIGALYPFLRIVFNRESLRDVVQQQVDQARQESVRWRAAMFAKPQRDPRSPAAATAGDAAAKFVESRRSLAFWSGVHRRYADWLPETPLGTLGLVLSVLMIGTVVKGVFMAANEVIVSSITQRALFDLRTRMFRHALTMDQLSVKGDNSSRLMARFTHDILRAGEGMGLVLGQAVQEPLKIIACLVGAAIVNWRLLLLSMLAAPAAVVAVRWISRSMKRASQQGLAAMADLYARLQETITNLQVVQANNQEGRERRRFHRVCKDLWSRLNRAARYRALTKPVTETLNLIGVSIALYAGAYLVLEQRTHLLGFRISDKPMTDASLFLFYAMLLGVSEPARKLGDLWVRIQHCMLAAERVEEALEVESMIQSPARPADPPPRSAALTFQQVRFAYRKHHPVLRNISLRFQPGEKVVLMGGNGSGKSTLIRMIPRFLDPREGRVFLGEVDLRDLHLRRLRDRIAVVPQDALLFDDTVLNNIRYGAPLASDEQVYQAARQAHAHDFIVDELNDGYDTQVGEGGSRLSGGQRQRIALARALLRNPDILILDEATSGIDSLSERLIYESIRESKRSDRITIIVAHRPAALQIADRVVVLNHGQVVLDAPSERALEGDVLRDALERPLRRTA